mmetsp:Transcript_16570/g.34318  ORF Transcript_16570/g.34318 Transcript_16570/m.34318 type:complete len:241 (+) Transcript_16570:956-1678(+)
MDLRGSARRGRQRHEVRCGLRDETRRYRGNGVPENRHAERLAKKVRVKAPLVVLADHPRLEDAEEQRCRNASCHTPNHENEIAAHVLGEARNYVEDAVQGRGLLSARAIGKGANEGAEDHRAAEAGYKERRVVACGEAIRVIESVDIGALQPIREHGDQVDPNVGLLEPPKVVIRPGLLTGAGLLRFPHDDASDRETCDEGELDELWFQHLCDGHFPLRRAQTCKLSGGRAVDSLEPGAA